MSRHKKIDDRHQSNHPQECPITGAPFFMTIEHPERGMVATYGGPFDSYTIPERDKEDGQLIRERFDHDAGAWVDGYEGLSLYVFDEDKEPSPQPVEAHSKSQLKRLTAMGVDVVEAGTADVVEALRPLAECHLPPAGCEHMGVTGHFTTEQIQAAREALQSKPTTEGRGWISTEERLPGEGETCFFIPTSGAVFGGFYKDGYFFRHGGRYTRNVVYWWQQVAYPLPPPPTKPETKEGQG
jgi:hypothetical protein